jgi:hypothetical protein
MTASTVTLRRLLRLLLVERIIEPGPLNTVTVEFHNERALLEGCQIWTEPAIPWHD